MPHENMLSLLSSLCALAFVLGLIWLGAKLLRHGGLSPALAGKLGIEASLALDPKRRLLLIHAEGRRFLLLTGGANDLLLSEWREPQP